MSRPQSTGLVVPVDAARELVAPWLHLLPAAGRSLPPHVTALWPFLPVEALDATEERRLEELLSGAEPFASSLTRVASLADATVLVPEPAEPFTALTRLLWDEWPECPPFGGAFDDVAPHLVVAIDPSAADRAAIETALAPRLPLAVRASEVLLVEETGSGALRERRRFRLGGPPA
jgi:2'-5' RNA ligase superfamily